MENDEQKAEALRMCHDDCFYYHTWKKNFDVVVAFGTLSFFLT